MCPDPGTGLFERISCDLWLLTGYLRSQVSSSKNRGTGPIALGQNSWVEVEAPESSLLSVRPDAVTFFFFVDNKLVEKIVDNGIDGLNPADSNDLYQMYTPDGRIENKIKQIDGAEAETELNRYYLERLDQILGALEDRKSIHGPVGWQWLAPGVEMSVVKAFRFIRLGRSDLVLLRIDPSINDLKPYYYKENGERPLKINQWAERIPEARALFNAGLYMPDSRPLGLFIIDGKSLGTRLHSKWEALMVSGGPDPSADKPDTASTRIIDLQYDDFSLKETQYRYFIQSFMILDRRGGVRVRRSENLASRTILAEDNSGNILVMMAPGGVSLYELALFLKLSELDIYQAMCLDGGFESQLFIRSKPMDMVYSGAFVVNESKQRYQEGLRLSLPTVIGVTPRK